jgi:hypothetical protein
MTKTITSLDQTEEALISLDVSDYALEFAANAGLRAGAYTVSFCTGLDTCPAAPAA